MRADCFTGKMVLATGGNSGMGLAAAQAFAREGAEIIISGRNQATIDAALASIGAQATGTRADVARLDDITRLMQGVRERSGRLDVLFANAGVAPFAPIMTVTEAEWDAIMNANPKGLYFTIQQALKLMGRGGAIVLNASVAAGKGVAGSSVYAASKAAVRSLGRSLGAELAGAGIRVNVVSPGPIETPLFGTLGMGTEAVVAMKRDWAAGNPMQRFGSADEVVRAVLFLASEEASYITGVELPVDGAGELFRGGEWVVGALRPRCILDRYEQPACAAGALADGIIRAHQPPPPLRFRAGHSDKLYFALPSARSSRRVWPRRHSLSKALGRSQTDSACPQSEFGSPTQASTCRL